jgi:diguanylate cyclase (GGDEF)-like protein
MSDRQRVLIISGPDAPAQGVLTGSLEQAFSTRRVRLLTAAVKELARSRFDGVVFFSGAAPAGSLHGLDELQLAAPAAAIVVVCEHPDDEQATEAVRLGAQECLDAAELSGPGLLRAMRTALERKREQLRLEHLAMHDSLTGLPNRALFMDRARLALARTRRGGARVAVLFIDLDRFKLVNDSLGHQAGDRVLIEVSQRFGEVLRPSDSVARAGGDEFVVLCEDLRGPRDAEAVAARLHQRLGDPFTVGGVEIRLNTSIGIALATDAEQTPEALLRNADSAMYRAKESRADWELFDARVRADVASQLRMQSDLHGALERGELRLHYQPLVELSNGGTVVGVEALLRWQHPRHGLLLPESFMTLVEETKLIVPVGEWVLEEGLRQLAAWEPVNAPDGLFVSVNVSVRQLEGRDFAKTVARVLESSGLQAEQLCVELTETAVMVDPREADRRLAELKALGVTIAIDDFGTGYTSMGQLERLPVDILKVDRSFVAGLRRSPSKHSVVAAVISLADALGMITLAEGVESPEDADALERLGCRLAQGNWYSPARAPHELIAQGIVASPPPPQSRPSAAGTHGEPVRVLLADDVAELRALLRSYLEADRTITVVGDVGDGEQAVRDAVALHADVIVLDLSMPHNDGLSAIERLRTLTPQIGIIVLSGFDSAFMQPRVLALGADHYLEKGTSLNDVRTTIHTLARERAGTAARAAPHASARRSGLLLNTRPPRRRRRGP